MSECPVCGSRDIERTSIGMITDKLVPDTSNTATCIQCGHKDRADRFGYMQGSDDD